MHLGYIGLQQFYEDLIVHQKTSTLYSGIYNLSEHYHLAPPRNYPLTSLYDDFKYLNKYPYINQHPALSIINISNPPFNTYNISSIGYESEYNYSINLSFSITLYSLQDSNLSFFLYNPNLNDNILLEHVLDDYYKLTIDGININLSNYYIPNPDSHLNLFTQILYPLQQNKTYNITFTFNTSIIESIDQDKLLLTSLQYPFD